MSGWVAIELRRRLGVPVVQLFHALGTTKQRHQGSADTSPGARIAIERQIVREADRVIAQCPAERAELLHDYAADAARLVSIAAAVNPQRFRPLPRAWARAQLGLPLERPIITYVGRMLPRKDVRNIVRALALLAREGPAPAPLLLLVGGETADADPLATPEIGVLQRLATELGVHDLVRFTGKRQPDELYLFYGAADVVVTTPWYEPFGLTPLEAMACARPVIGAAVGGIRFTVQHGVTGWLVPPRDPQALAVCLRHVLSQPDLRLRMGRAARRRVLRAFTWPLTARRTLALYEALAAHQVEAEPAALAVNG